MAWPAWAGVDVQDVGHLQLRLRGSSRSDVFCFYFLHTEHRLPWPFAAVIAIVVFAPISAWLELLARR